MTDSTTPPQTETQDTDQRATAVQQIIAECSEISTFIRTRWHDHSASIHPEVTRGTMPTLVAIARHEPISATELICRFGFEKTLLSKQVAQLRSLGLIETRVSESDRRVTLLLSTTDTKERLAHVRGMIAEDYNERLRGWSVADLEQLHVLLNRFNHPAV